MSEGVSCLELMKRLQGTIFEKCIIFHISGDTLQLLHSPVVHKEILYLYKYGNFYLARNRMYIIPECPVNNIVEINEDYCILPEHLKLERQAYAVFYPRSEYLYALSNADEKSIRLLLDIFKNE